MGAGIQGPPTRRAVPRRLALVVVLPLALVGVAATAFAAFTPPVDLSAPGQHAGDPAVATDADGDSIAVWRRFDGAHYRIQARTISAAGALGPVQDLSNADRDARDPQVASAADGDSIAVWSRDPASGGGNSRIQARRISAAGALGGLRTISARNWEARLPQVATDADGDSIAVWQLYTGTQGVQARRISAGGKLGAIQDLAGQALRPQVATDARGDSIAVWSRYGPDERVQARSISAAGALGDVLDLSAAGESGYEPEVATDADGDSIAVWGIFDLGKRRVQARTISAAGTLGAIRGLTGPGKDSGRVQVATDADGDSIAVWERFDGADRITARAISAAGALGPAISLSVAGQDAVLPQVATDADGDSIAVWLGYDGSEHRVQARTISAAGTLGAVQDLSAAGEDASVPGVATDAQGESIAVWPGFDGTSYRIQAAQGP